MTTSGAPAALHGYRVQALYTLKRILTQANNNYIFHPEGLEDLDIYSSDKNQVELIQVKKYSPLQLSHLEPEKPNGFFRRVLTQQHRGQLRIRLVNFGPIGQELQGAWQGEEKAKISVKQKLQDHGYAHDEIEVLFNSIEFVEIDEESEKTRVYSLLRDLYEGIDPQNAFDLLHHWMFTVMEQRREIAYSDVVEKLNSVGLWLTERRSYYTQFHTTIQPLQASPNVHVRQASLQREFYEGGFTTYDHIFSNLDFPRNDKLAEIADGFSDANVVIVHAASGQGKTTLALRYLHNRYPDGWRFSIARIENVQHALSAANALSGFAKALEVPVPVYLDVKPSDTDWIEFARQLARHPYVRVLVTIREEDYRRTITSADFAFRSIDLNFDENEAKILYERAQSTAPQRQFLNFEAAWDAFRRDGPLLEFVYLITQTETLRQRLQGQINRILNEVREKQLGPDEIQLLRLVAVATACEARVSTRKLLNSLSLPEPSTTLKFFDEEYLVRVSEFGFIEGLHSIRSRILVDLLTDADINPWLGLAEQVIPLLLEEDLESFILNAAVDYASDFPLLLGSIRGFQPSTWSGVAGILRTSIWADIKLHVLRSRDAIDEARKEFGSGWYFIAPLNSMSDDIPNLDKWWQSEELSSLFSPERIERLNAIRDMQPSNVDIFSPTKLWLEKISTPSQPPTKLQDWSGTAFTLYWASILTVAHLHPPTIDAALPFFVLADVVYALSKYAPEQYSRWLTDHESQLAVRLANELGVLHLQSEDNCLNIHFLVSERDVIQGDESDPLHAATIQRLQLIRQLYPNYDQYGSQGYGHKLGNAMPLDFDSTYKLGVNREQLAPTLTTWANRLAVSLASYELRLETWKEYVEKLVETRHTIIKCLNQLHENLQIYIRSQVPVNVGAYLNKDDWKHCLSMLDNYPDLPKSAVVPWGFASESRKQLGNKWGETEMDGAQKSHAPTGITLEIYRPYVNAQREYFSHLRNFIQQTVHVTAVNFNVSKLPLGRMREVIEKELAEQGIRTDRAHLSTHNFWDAKRQLPLFQKEFRNLFEHIVDGSLEQLETEEQRLLSQTWVLWHHYAHKPTHTLSNPLRDVAHNTENEKRIIDRLLRRALSQFSNKQYTATQLYADLLWEQSSVLTVQLNVYDGTKLYEAFNALIAALHSQFHSLRYEDLKHYLIREKYERIIIVPTIRSRLVNENAWVLHTISTILNQQSLEKHNWVSYSMKRLSVEWLEALSLPKWQLPQVQQANEISRAVSLLRILTSQIAELSSLSEVNEESVEPLQASLQQHSQSLSELLQQFFDHGAAMLDLWNGLSDQEKTRRKHLSEAIVLLAQLYPFILPSESDTDQYHLQLDDVVAYSQRLSQALPSVEYLRLLLIADAIESFKA